MKTMIAFIFQICPEKCYKKLVLKPATKNGLWLSGASITRSNEIKFLKNDILGPFRMTTFLITVPFRMTRLNNK